MSRFFCWSRRFAAALSLLANANACSHSESNSSSAGAGGPISGGATATGHASAVNGGSEQGASFGGATATGNASAVNGGSGKGGSFGGATTTGNASAANGGSGQGGSFGGTTSTSGPSTPSGGAALVNPAPGSKSFVGVNFWRVDWEGALDFFLSNVTWQTVQNPWQPQLLDDLAPFSVLRFMDWNLTNDDPNSQSDWATRKLPTQSQTNEPIAFEWQIDLCNRTQKDCWLTVPIQANASFQEQLAQLVHDRLDAKLRLYVEYSNEVWNGGFPQAKVALARSDQLNLPVTANSCCTTDTIKTGNAYVYGAVRLFERFESVFGKGSPRLVKVLSGQSAWDGPCQVHMAALKDTAINPNGTLPTVYAVAPYFGGTSIGALSNAIADAAKGVRTHVSCAAKQNLAVIGYEGGSDSYAAGNGCVTLQHDAGMYDLYQAYYDALVAAGMKGPIMQYTAVGACWGLKEKTSDTVANSPKYRAATDWLAKQP